MDKVLIAALLGLFGATALGGILKGLKGQQGGGVLGMLQNPGGGGGFVPFGGGGPTKPLPKPGPGPCADGT